MNYWGYRIDIENQNYLFEEIKHGRLRQGWGYNDGQNLRKPHNMDKAAKGNYPIFYKVRKNDILLIPITKERDDIAIVIATGDFSEKYIFVDEENNDLNDYRHIFPVSFIKCFSRNSLSLDNGLRRSFYCHRRFWNISKYEEQISQLLK